jgi:hypothetical protein
MFTTDSPPGKVSRLNRVTAQVEILDLWQMLLAW